MSFAKVFMAVLPACLSTACCSSPVFERLGRPASLASWDRGHSHLLSLPCHQRFEARRGDFGRLGVTHDLEVERERWTAVLQIPQGRRGDPSSFWFCWRWV